jgi:hypothetical protein
MSDPGTIIAVITAVLSATGIGAECCYARRQERLLREVVEEQKETVEELKQTNREQTTQLT